MSMKKKHAVLICSVVAILCLLAGLFFLLFHFGVFDSLGLGPGGKNSVRVPILMYHHFADEGEPGTIISSATFESQLKALSDAGYSAISFDELCAYVSDGVDLPDRPVIITIDDGYGSVYETAFPLLKKYNMKATVFIIGVSHGKSVYKDTNYLIIPRFSDAEALEMSESGFMSVQTHSYDMHQHEPYETGPFRTGVLQMDGESRDEYIAAFTADFERAASQLEDIVGIRPFVFSYPFGKHSELSEKLLRDLGVKVTLTIDTGVNTVVRNSPNCLYKLKRFNVPGDMSPERLLEMIG